MTMTSTERARNYRERQRQKLSRQDIDAALDAAFEAVTGLQRGDLVVRQYSENGGGHFGKEARAYRRSRVLRLVQAGKPPKAIASLLNVPLCAVRSDIALLVKWGHLQK